MPRLEALAVEARQVQLELQYDLFVTQPSPDGSSIELSSFPACKADFGFGKNTVLTTSSSTGTTTPTGGIYDGVRMHSGRPNLAKIIEAAATSHFVSKDSGLAVLACGPPAMVDDTRVATVSAIGSAKCRIEYHEALLLW